MPYYHICAEKEPAAAAREEELFLSGKERPLLILWESGAALFAEEKINAPLPVVIKKGRPRLSGRGAMHLTLAANEAERAFAGMIRSTLLRLDADVVAKDGFIFSGSHACGSYDVSKDGTVASGTIYYSIAQTELSRFSRFMDGEYMSLSLVAPGITRLYLFGALVYSFELKYGRAEKLFLSGTADKSVLS